MPSTWECEMKPLLKLLASNRRAPVKRADMIRGEADRTATVFIYDAIVSDPFVAEIFGGVAAEPFAKEIAALDVDELHVRINSPGGDVMAGRAIEAAIREHKAKTVVHIDGLAASAASFVAIAADEVVMQPGALLMVHNAWSWAIGNAADLRGTADLLEKVDNTLVRSYAEATGKDEATIRQWMDAETWFDGPEALEAGFIDGLAEDQGEETAVARAQWDLSAYEHAPGTAGRKAEKFLPEDESPAVTADGFSATDDEPEHEPARDPVPAHLVRQAALLQLNS